MISYADQFTDVLDDLADHIRQNPFQYPNEDSIIDELYYRCRTALDTVYLPIEFHTDYGDDSDWRVTEAADRVRNGPGDGLGTASRLRTEVSFVSDGHPFTLSSGATKRFDVALFADDPPLYMQSKAPGPGDHWAVENDLTVLCEVKHSCNMTSRFYADKYGAGDIAALSEYPGTVDHRIFLFVDWWPRQKDGTPRYDTHMDKLQENVAGQIIHPVTVIYVPRRGTTHSEQLGEWTP